MMNVLLLGGGGREHALAYKISESSLLKNLYIMPGNPGTAILGTNISGNPSDFDAVKRAVLQNNVDMVIVGPEAPLVNGIHDCFISDESLRTISVIGPVAGGARLEGSKEFAKEFMQKHDIPTAKYSSFNKDSFDDAVNMLKSMKPPYVLKADGLAAGKGVVILDSLKEALDETEKILLQGKFGEAGNTIVIEEFLDGIEMSVFILTDGKDYILLPEAKDYKRIGEGDTGLNTGGMGSLSPVPFFDDNLKKKIIDRIIDPTVNGLIKENIPYTGFMFFGLMIVNENPYVIEYNVRLGDPEAESILPRVKNDLLSLLSACADKTLNEHVVNISNNCAVTVMVVSAGYPGKYEKGKVIEGLDELEDSILFHAGTIERDKKILTNGGRVFAVTTLKNNLRKALEASINNAEKIKFQGRYFRRDLGFDLDI